jgi:AAA+ superfamily predicted ATPase
MPASDLLTGGVIAGLFTGIIGFWNQIKAILWKLASIIIQKVEINTEEANDAVVAFLTQNFIRIPVYDRVYGATNEMFRVGKYGLVPFEKFGSRTIFYFSDRPFRKWIPFAFKKEIQPQQNPEQGGRQQAVERKFSSFVFIRGTLKVDIIVEKAAQARNELFWKHTVEAEESSRFDIFYMPNKENNNYAYYSKESSSVAWYKQNQYRLLGIKQNELGRERSSGGSALNNLYFPTEIKDLIKIISLWVKSKDWYKAKNIPWKRGWLLYGLPGTGKTALVRAFAEDLNMPIYVFSLSQMSNNDLTMTWKRMQVNIPCIALIEDIDTVFHKRENISRDSGILGALLNQETSSNPEGGQSNNQQQGIKYSPLTFDCLLNCLDGVDKSNGVFTIITTNKIEDIDEAIGVPVKKEDGSHAFISSRPGRIDRAIELTYMTAENKVEMANKILSEFPEQLSEVLASLEKRGTETPAQFQEVCSEIAIREFWKENERQGRLFKGTKE